jgi:subtilisin family serine protease
MAKLDPEIEHLIRDFQQIEEDTKALSAGRSAKPDSIVYISIHFEGDITEIKKTGFDTGTVIGNIAYGATTLQNLVQLSRHPQVIAIEKQRKKHLLLDKSIPNIKANQVWSRSGDSFSGYTGKDVVIGIVDTGIDFRHENFRKTDSGKTTRILKIWDQTLQAGSGEAAPGAITDASIGAATLGYGVEYNATQINNSMGSSGPVRHIDENSHGTHVAGIAAGDGSQSGGCHLSYHYVGVAPDADLIIVRMFGLSASDRASTSPPSGNHMMNAIMYIMNEAKKINKPVSINLSLGSFTEKMDGTSSDSQAIDTLLTNNSTGTSIIFAAGNEGASDFHAKGDVPAGNADKLDLRFKVSPNDSKDRYLVILYSGSNLQIRLTSPVGGTNGQINWVTQAARSGSSTTANGTGGNVSVSNNVDRIRITISPPTDGNNIA